MTNRIIQDFNEQLENGELRIKLADGTFLELELVNTNSIRLLHGGRSIAVYKRACRECGHRVGLSNHCKGIHWYFCNECFKNREIRHRLFATNNVTPPFKDPKCKKNNCTLCKDHEQWLARPNNDDSDDSHVSEESQNRQDGDEASDELNSLSDSINKKPLVKRPVVLELSDSDTEEIAPPAKTRRLRRRDGGSAFTDN
jgi:hypothetical protein